MGGNPNAFVPATGLLEPSHWQHMPRGWHGKRRANACGIYAITSASGKVYVGSAVDVAHRLCEHFRHLRNGRHANPKLQASWNRHAPEDFDGWIIALVPEDRLLDAEQVYLDELFAWGHGYNIARFPRAPMRGRHHTEEHKRRVSEQMRGNRFAAGRRQPADEVAHRARLVSATLTGKPLSEEHKEALRRGWEKRRKWWTMSDETRSKKAEATRKLWAQAEYRQTQSENGKALWQRAGHKERMCQIMTGKKRSLETRARMSRAQKGRIISAEARENMRAAALRRHARERAA